MSFHSAGFCSAKDTKEVAAPDRSDLFLGVTSTDQLTSDIGRFSFAVEADDAGAMVEIGANPDMLPTNPFSDIVDVIDELA